MPDFIDHIYQYKHNQACAQHLLNHTQYVDWAVTAAFYSALHIVDAGLNKMNILFVTSTTKDTQHSWREQQSRVVFGEKCFRAYRALHIASDCARYLTGSPQTSTSSVPAITRLSPDNIKNCINIDLQTVLNEVDKKCGNIK